LCESLLGFSNLSIFLDRTRHFFLFVVKIKYDKGVRKQSLGILCLENCFVTSLSFFLISMFFVEFFNKKFDGKLKIRGFIYGNQRI